MLRDGQLMFPRMDTGLTLAPAWPSAKKVLDVKEQVATSEIPAEYYHKSPVSKSHLDLAQIENTSIMLTCPCNVDPLTPHFSIVKLGFTRV